MKQVLILDDDVDLCEIMTELLLSLGASRCLAAHSLRDLQELPSEQTLVMDLAILDVNLGAGEPSGIDAYRWLRESGFRGRLVFLTGHAQTHPLIRLALDLPNVTLLTKPAPIEQLEELLRS